MVRMLIFSTLSLPIIVLAIIGAIFLVKPMPPQPVQQPVQKLFEKEMRMVIKSHAMEDFRNKRWADLRHIMDSLFTVIDFLNDSLKRQQVKMDTLAQKTREFQARFKKAQEEIENLQKKMVANMGQQQRIKDLAKTLSGLKGKNLSKILAKMDDESLIQIYQQMSTTAKKNLLANLPANRAAALAQKLLKN